MSQNGATNNLYSSISLFLIGFLMFPKPFDYFAPHNLSEALELLKDEDVETKVLAGGQSLIPAMKQRILSPKIVVDLGGIEELNYIRKDVGMLKIGSLTTSGTLENDATVALMLPILTETASQIADPLVRNLGTVGGDLCQADPANDLPAVTMTLNASFTIANKQETHNVSADDFFVDAFKTVLKPNEILTEIQIPIEKGRVGSAYRKVRKGSGGFAIAGVAANVLVSNDNCVSGCRIALTAVGPKPLRAQKAEQALLGKVPDAAVLDNVVRLALEASKPVTDITASVDYRRKVLGLLVRDAVETAYKTCGEW
jgi:carbon-monoxide dehydrogenase medium subunit